MKEYYKDKWVTIYHGDCREILPQLQKVDLVLTDPPYGVGMPYDGYEDSVIKLRQLIDGTLSLLLNKSKRVVLTCGIANLMLYPQPNWIIAWIYRSGRGLNPWGFNCWTPIMCWGKDPYLANGLGSRPDIIECPGVPPVYDHPCPKPERFWQLLLARVSVDVSDIVLDPFMGTGTTVRVSKNLNRKSIGIEVSEKYCEIAARRCSQEVMDFTQ